MNAIEARGITKVYGAKTVIHHVNLEVKSNEIYGFLGRNGAGKSTFINIITGIVHPTTGTFQLLNEPNLENVKHRIGVLPDYSSFYDSMTAVDHLKYYSSIIGYKMSKERCEQVLKKVGLSEHANKKVGKFSFGMKKKLGIAQAIVHDPELIFLDEPTSGIDVESSLEIHKLIKDLHNEGKTIFMTSHNLHEVEKICTRIAIMKDGRIFSEGTLEELKSKHMSALHVQIKHSSVSDPSWMESMLHEISKEIKTSERITSLVVDSEEKIPRIVRALTEQNIDIYRIHVHEPSLEEIFLSE